MVRNIITFWDQGSTYQQMKNVIYDDMTKAEAFKKFEEEFGIETFPIINIIQL